MKEAIGVDAAECGPQSAIKTCIGGNGDCAAMAPVLGTEAVGYCLTGVALASRHGGIPILVVWWMGWGVIVEADRPWLMTIFVKITCAKLVLCPILFK